MEDFFNKHCVEHEYTIRSGSFTFLLFEQLNIYCAITKWHLFFNNDYKSKMRLFPDRQFQRNRTDENCTLCICILTRVAVVKIVNRVFERDSNGRVSPINSFFVLRIALPLRRIHLSCKFALVTRPSV